MDESKTITCRCTNALRPSRLALTPLPRRGAEKCSIDPRTQPVLTLRQSSLRLVAVCPSTAYGRVGLWFFAFYSYIFFRQPAYTSPLYRTIIILLIILLISDFVVKEENCLLRSLLFEENIHCLDTWTAIHEEWSRHRRDALSR